MSNNYRTSLAFDLREQIEITARLRPAHEAAEKRFLRAEKALHVASEFFANTQTEFSRSKEEFRKVHREYSSAKTKIGEIQSELFSSAEDEEDWFH